MPGKTRVCLIGCGPSGLSMFAQAKQIEGCDESVEITCFERQSEPGGMWVYNENTDETNDDGLEGVANSQYGMLFSNAPKEAHEFPDYTYFKHFGRSIPSFPPREPILNYLVGRTKHHNPSFRERVNFNTYVENVSYNAKTKKFTVVSTKLQKKNKVPADPMLSDMSGVESSRGALDLGSTFPAGNDTATDLEDDFLRYTTESPTQQEFDYLVVGTGHFSKPRMIKFEGQETFPGSIIHCHNIRQWEFAEGLRLCVVGGSYSAEDIALQTIKNGKVKAVTIVYRSAKLEFNGWPEQVNFAREIENIEGSTINFKSGHSGVYDMIILATGYLHSFDFLEDDIKLKTENCLYPPLYDGVVLPKNKKVMYLGMQNQLYSFPLFDIQARYILNVVMKKIKLPNMATMLNHCEKKAAEEKALANLGEMAVFQWNMMMAAAKKAKYPNAESMDALQVFGEWLANKAACITTFRDQSHRSMHGERVWGAKPEVTWMKNMDDTECGMLATCSPWSEPSDSSAEEDIQLQMEAATTPRNCCVVS